MTHLKELPIGTQLKLSFTAMLLLVLALGVASYVHTKLIQQQGTILYEHPLQVRRALGELKSDILTIQRNMKDLFLLGNNAHVAQLLSLNESLKSNAYEQLNIIYSQYLGSRADVDAAKQAFIQWNALREVTLRMLQAGRIEEAGGAGSLRRPSRRASGDAAEGGRGDRRLRQKQRRLLARQRREADRLAALATGGVAGRHPAFCPSSSTMSCSGTSANR